MGKYKIVISHPTEIYQALSQVYYHDFSITTEERVEALHNLQSAKSYKMSIVPKLFLIAVLIGLVVLFWLFPQNLLIIMQYYKWRAIRKLLNITTF